MHQDNTIICKEILQYFSTMIPSHSHEAKNVLAVINENAGLMDDYFLMAQKGKSLNLERLSSLSTTIRKQVVRLNDLITDVRQAAEGINNNKQEICLANHTRQVSDLLSKKAATRSIRFQVSAGEEPILIPTQPLLLLHMLWVCFDYAMGASKQGCQIDLTLENGTRDAVVLISGIDDLESATLTSIMPDEQRNAVLSALNAELKIDKHEKIVMLTIRKHHA